jgi:O-antigen/teichoic acid export membrane protein
MLIQKNIQWTMLYQIGIALLNFLVIVVITKILGDSGRGAIAVYNQTIALFTTFIGFSLGSGIVYFVASKKISIAQMQRVIILFMLSIAVILGIVYLILHWNVANIYTIVLPATVSKKIIFYCCLHIWCTVFFLHLGSLLNAQNVFIIQLKIMLAYLIMLLAGIAYCYYFQLIISSFSFLKYNSLLYTGITFFLLLFAWGKNKASIFGTPIPLQLVKQLFAFTALAFLCNSIQLLSYRVDIWYLNYYFPDQLNWIGIYSIATLFIQTLWILPNALSTIFYTKFSYQINDTNAVAQKVARISSISLWIFGLLFIFTWMNSYWLIPLIFGANFKEAANYFGLLMIGAIPIASALIISTYNASNNNLKINLFGSIIGLILCLILNPILIPKYKVYGACIVSILAYSGNAIYLYYQFLKAHPQIKLVNLLLPKWNWIKNLKQTINEL